MCAKYAAEADMPHKDVTQQSGELAPMTNAGSSFNIWAFD